MKLIFAVLLIALTSCSTLKPTIPTPVDTCGIQKQQNTIMVTK